MTAPTSPRGDDALREKAWELVAAIAAFEASPDNSIGLDAAHDMERAHDEFQRLATPDVVLALLDHVATLTARLSLAEGDSARLDWIAEQYVTLRLSRPYRSTAWNYQVIVNGNHASHADHADLRSALDAARSAALPTTEGESA